MKQETTTEARLQAYLNDELSDREREDVEHQLSIEAEQREQLAMLSSQEEEIVGVLRLIQEEPTTDVDDALACFHEYRREMEVSNVTPSPRWRRWLDSLRWWQTPLSIGAAACAVAMLAILPGTWQSPPDASMGHRQRPEPRRKTSPAHRMIAKGGAQAKDTRHAYLHIGISDQKGKISMVGHGDALDARQSLLFTMVLQRAGYVYLVLETPRATRLLYPFGGFAKTLSKGRHLIRHKQMPQRYRLSRHRGSIAFVLLHSPKPLPARLRNGLSAARGQIDEAAIQQVVPAVSFDRIALRVVPAKGER